jgi:DNA polymerase III delta subunit
MPPEKYLTYLDFRKEVDSGEIKHVYFVSASDTYFVGKASELLREKVLGSGESRDNYFLKYADETKYNEILDLCLNFTSLFSSRKLLVVKKCEKLARNLRHLLEYSASPDENTVLMLVFDKDYVADSKVDKEYGFYDFSSMPRDSYLNWIIEEFKLRGCLIKDHELSVFASSASSNFDTIVQEIAKISNYLDSGDNKEKYVTEDSVLRSIGYERTYTPEDLMVSILEKDSKRSLDILHFLLYKSGISDIFLLSIISSYYADLLCFKTRGILSTPPYELYNKYRIWRERAEFAKKYSNKIPAEKFAGIFKYLVQTDKKLKSTMIEPGVLMTALIEGLLNI